MLDEVRRELTGQAHGSRKTLTVATKESGLSRVLAFA